MRAYNSISLLLGLLFSIVAAGQIEQYEIEYPWKHHVSRMEPDSLGYFWLHDDNDFYYYNGHQISKAGLGDILGKKKNDYSFSGDIIWVDGGLVFINDNQISLFNPLKRSITPQWQLPEGDLFNHLYRDDLGKIWVFATNPNKGTRPVYRAEEALDFQFAFDLFPFMKEQGIFWDFELTDRDGLLYIHRRLGGLIILDNQGNEVPAPVNNLLDFENKRECSQFRLDNQNNLWRIYKTEFEILDWETGVFRRHGVSDRFEFITECKQKIEAENIRRGLEGFGSLLNLRSIYVDSRDRVWLSCSAAYLVMYDPSKEKVVGFRTPIVKELEGGDFDNKFIFEDVQGNIWGSQKGGIFKIRDKEVFFKSYVVNTSKSDHPIYKSEDQTTIKNSIRHYGDYAIRNSAVHGIGEDEKGQVIFQEGVFTYQLDLISEDIKVLPLFNPKEKVHLTVEEDLKVYASWDSYYKISSNYSTTRIGRPINKIENIFRQRNGTMWFSGLLNQHDFMFGMADPNTLEFEGNFQDDEGKVNFNLLQVRGVSEGSDGFLWLATAEGIYKLNPKTKKIEQRNNTYSYNGSTYSIGIGVSKFQHFRDHLFWFKSDYEYGLIDVDSNRILYLNQIDEELSGNQLQILPIDDHSLWIGDSRGVSYFDFSNNSNFILSIEEGIDTKGAVNVLRKLKSGLIAVGTNSGLYTFNPTDILTQAKVRKIHDQSIPLYVNGYSYSNSRDNLKIEKQFLAQSNLTIELDHTHRDLAIEVSLKEFNHPNRHNYRYRLFGFESDWSNRTANNIISYTSLPPGDYKLQILGSASGGIWSNKVLNIDISVTDIWYRSWWFAVMILIGISLLVYFITRYYQGQKLQRQLTISAVRDQISRDLHDDVGTILTGVAMQSELLEEFVDEQSKSLAKNIAERSREAMGRMRDTVWAIDSRRDSLEDLKDRMMDFMDETINSEAFKYSFKHDVNKKNIILPPDVRQAAFLIFKESIVNIVKHSDTQKCDIEIISSNQNLTLIINDEGSQKSRIKTSGQGLSNMASRAKSLKGQYSFTYDEGYQTKLVLPIT